MKVKKAVSLFLAVVLLFVPFVPICVQASSAPTRVIHVVYDDSGSMVEDDNDVPVDTWCQAKYAMEVFAALLGERDTMNIYYMSDFTNSTDSGPKLSLSGTDSQKANVEKIHNTVSDAGLTPFNTVQKAYSDLTAASADDKWLIVLTDGEFQGIGDINGFFAQKASDVNIMFLGMGAGADRISERPENGVFYRKAETSGQILQEITSICTQVFNSHRLEVNVSAKTVEFDVPMAELVVFAQGANVSISGITGADGKEYLSSSDPVTVQYSERAALNRTEFIVARDLKGSVATFKDDFNSGRYTIDVSGADTIEVYYKPNIEIAAYLRDMAGQEVTSMANLKQGDYMISFGLVKAGTDEKVNESKLLGTVGYSAQITNGVQDLGGGFSSGDSVHLEEGQLDIDVTASYLEYNTVSTHLSYQIYDDKDVGFETDSGEWFYTVTNAGSDFTQPFELAMQISGGITQEQWASLSVPNVTAVGEHAEQFGKPRVEKSTEPGFFLVYPTEPENGLSLDKYEFFEYSVEFEGKVGEAAWLGNAQGKIPVQDTRTRVVKLTVEKCPDYSVTKDGMDNSDPILVWAEFEGETPTQEIWAGMSFLDVRTGEGENSDLYGGFTVEKTDEIGVYKLFPNLKSGLMSYETYGDFELIASYHGGEGTPGNECEVTQTVRVTDQRTWIERNMQLVIRLAILAAILLLILGYIPPFKKYLPKSLKRRPNIECVPNRRGVHQASGNGKYVKKLSSTLIPYRAERGTIKFVPSGAPGVPPMQVKAAGGSAMLLMNTKAYAGKEHIQFNGAPVEEGRTKPLNISAGTLLTVTTKDFTYNSSPNQ